MKKILAVALIFSLVFAFAACGGKEEEAPTTTAPEITQAAENLDMGDSLGERPTQEPVTEVVTEVITNAEGETEIATEVITEVVTEGAKAPSGKAEIVAYFNDAVNNVKTNAKSLKRHYSKISLNGSCVLPGAVEGILKMLGGADKFIGDQLAKNSKGEETYTGGDIKAVYPVEGEAWASKLTVDDVESAKIGWSEDGKNYVIVIKTVSDGKSTTVKHGEGHAPKAFNVVLPGVVNENIPGIATGIVGEASMNYPSCTATIVVDPATGNVLEATYDLKWTINFDKAGVIIPFTTLDYFTITY